MSLDEQLDKMNTIDKIKFAIDWFLDPHGKDLVETIKIYNLKLISLIKIVGFVLRGFDIKNSIIKARDEFSQTKIKTIAKSRDGLLFYILNGAEMDLVRSSREKFVNEYFVPIEGDVIIDIGANIGTFSVKSAHHVLKKGKVIAIEADPNTFTQLKKNIELNKLENIIPINLAVFNKKTALKLNRANSSGESSLKFSKGSEYIQVNTQTLDEVLTSLRIKKIDWIKIDVEGSEVEVLEGATKTLQLHNNLKMLIELHFEGERDIIENILKENNFSIKRDSNVKTVHIFAEKYSKYD